MNINPESVARSSSRHPWLVIGGWGALLAVTIALTAVFLSKNLDTGFEFSDQPESDRASTLLESRLRGPATFTELIVVTSEPGDATNPDFQRYVTELQSAVSGLGPNMVGGVVSIDPPVLSADLGDQLITVILAVSDIDEAIDTAEIIGGTVEQVTPPAGVEAKVFGQGSVSADFIRLADEGMARGETIGLVAALIVLLVVIGAVVAAGLPILLAIAAITAALGITAYIGNFITLSFTAVSFITMMGLAVGVDYALFIVARYREERRRGLDKYEAIGRAGATANRAVLFSGFTVILALLGLLLEPSSVFRSLAISAVVVVLLAVVASMTLLPAVLALLGDRIDVWSLRKHKTSGSRRNMWDGITNSVMARPVLWLVVGAGFMLLLATSALRIETGFSGVSTLPDDVESKQAFEILEQEFGLGGVDPVEIVIDGPVTEQVELALDALTASLDGDPRLGSPAPLEVNSAGDLALLSVPLSGDPESEDSRAAVETLRAETIPMAFAGTDTDVLVGGTTAFEVDFEEDVAVFTPLIFAFVLGFSFVLLTVVFRSVVLPIKAILLNLLSVGATYGALVLAFQPGEGPGWIRSMLGFEQAETIEAWVPLFLFAVLFGLSMDYHVFMLTRIREHFDRTGDNAAAVAHGLRTTGSIITGAALIMVAVFIGFALGDLVALQQMGFGLAVAVFLDATIVRTILVPASMRLLGAYNWYLPKWLEWLPRLEVERTGHTTP